MSDRRAKVTVDERGRTHVEGTAYVADAPNVNGVIYPKPILEKALGEFLKSDYRPVTYGCTAEPKLGDLIGEVQDGWFEGNELKMSLLILPTKGGVTGLVNHPDIALAGSGVGKANEVNAEGVLTITEFKIVAVGIVGITDVTPEESS